MDQPLPQLPRKKFTSLRSLLDTLPPEARQWVESLPWEKRRYVLSLCYLLSATPPEVQAEFLDDYTADGLVSKLLEDRDTKQRVMDYLQEFHIDTQIDEKVLRQYIRQFYIHSAQDTRTQPNRYLESALRLVTDSTERNNVFNYILGAELIKMMFRMSWLQHERLYRLQRNQEEFIQLFIRPIQHAHRINRIIVPRNEKQFFARREYFVQCPLIPERKLVELMMATFTAEIVTHLGFSLIRHHSSFQFDYDLIFADEPQEAIFNP
ncbi:MAG: cobyrinic acid a,c-diamide synthase [Thainema sp.]